jgi:hypothetical protein
MDQPIVASDYAVTPGIGTALDSIAAAYSAISTEEPDVSTPTVTWNDQRQKRELVSLVMAGRDAVRASCRDGDATTGILRRERAETKSEFQRRRNQSELVNFLAAMVQDHAGRLFRRAPAFGEDVPEEIRGIQSKNQNEARGGWAENIDLRQNHLHEFGKQLYLIAKEKGGAGIWVDMPPVPKNAKGQTLEIAREDQKRNARRPYWVHIDPDDAIDLTPRYTGGIQRLAVFRRRITSMAKTSRYDPGTPTNLIYEYWDGLAPSEATSSRPGVPEGHPAFNFQAQPDLIVPPGDQRRNARFFIHKGVEIKGKMIWAEISKGSMAPLNFIPLVWYQCEKRGSFCAIPPKETQALAETTCEHFRKKSAIDSFIRTANVSVIHRSGWSPELVDPAAPQNELNENRFFSSPDAQATMEFVEPKGASLLQSREDLKEVEDRAGRQAMEPLLANKGGMTATDAAIRNAKANSQLEAQLLAYIDCVETAMDYTMQWTGKAPGNGGSLLPNLSGLAIAQGGSYAEVIELFKEKVIGRVTAIKEAVRYDRLAEDTKVQDILAELKKEPGEDPAVADILAAIKMLRQGRPGDDPDLSRRTEWELLQKMGLIPKFDPDEEEKRLADEEDEEDTEIDDDGGDKKPSMSLSFKDLPPEGQIQLAAMAGIELDASDVEEPEPAPVPPALAGAVPGVPVVPPPPMPPDKPPFPPKKNKKRPMKPPPANMPPKPGAPMPNM